MFKKLIFVIFIVFTPSAFASDWSFGEIFSIVDTLNTNVSTFLFDDVPDLFTRFFAYVIEFIIYMTIKMKIAGIELAFYIAHLVLSDFGFVQLIENLAGQLPTDIRYAAVKMRIFDAFNLIVEAYIARLAMSYL